MENFFWLDTDIGPDCDDAAAIAIFLSLCAEGRAVPLGITHCTESPYGLPTIDAIQRAFGVSLPLGTCADAEFLNGLSVYNRAIAEHFEHAYPPERPQPDALDAMRAGFNAVPDGSITLIGIGPMNNLSRALLDRETGALFQRKVNRLVLMAGCFERAEPAVEWNVEMDVAAARNVIARFAGKIDFCPFESAAEVLTGACLAEFPNNPVSEAYRLFTRGTMLRPSWDLATVAAAILSTGLTPRRANKAYKDCGKISDAGTSSALLAANGACKVRGMVLNDDTSSAPLTKNKAHKDCGKISDAGASSALLAANDARENREMILNDDTSSAPLAANKAHKDCGKISDAGASSSLLAANDARENREMILNDDMPFAFSELGNVSIDPRGATRFTPDPNGRMRILRCKDSERGAEMLESLLKSAVSKMNGAACNAF